MLVLLVLGPMAAAACGTRQSPRVATIDWGQAQTLIAIGAPPAGMAQISAYGDWVDSPPVPESVREIGLRAQPNMELLAQMDLDTITITPMYENTRGRLSRVAPVKAIDIYFRDGSAWDNTIESTRRLGALVHCEAAAERVIESARDRIDRLAQSVPDTTRPLLVVQFIDARHVRVFGPDSLLGNVMARMGIDNAWTQDTNLWGFALVPIERLASVKDARMAVLDPMPVGVAGEVADSVLWQHLPAVRGQTVLDLPAVWSFGGLPSATRFARVLAKALESLGQQATGATASRAP